MFVQIFYYDYEIKSQSYLQRHIPQYSATHLPLILTYPSLQGACIIFLGLVWFVKAGLLLGRLGSALPKILWYHDSKVSRFPCNLNSLTAKNVKIKHHTITNFAHILTQSYFNLRYNIQIQPYNILIFTIVIKLRTCKCLFLLIKC